MGGLACDVVNGGVGRMILLDDEADDMCVPRAEGRRARQSRSMRPDIWDITRSGVGLLFAAVLAAPCAGLELASVEPYGRLPRCSPPSELGEVVRVTLARGECEPAAIVVANARPGAQNAELQAFFVADLGRQRCDHVRPACSSFGTMSPLPG